MRGICLSFGAKWEEPQEGAWLAGIGRLDSHYKGCGDHITESTVGLSWKNLWGGRRVLVFVGLTI